MTKQYLYIAGPMSGIYQHNLSEFMEAQKLLSPYYEVFNPAIADINNGFDIRKVTGKESKEELATLGFDIRKFMGIDLFWILQKAEGIALLDEWWKSEGVGVEVSLAHLIRIPVYPVNIWVEMAQTKERV